MDQKHGPDHWRAMGEDIFSETWEWRLQHPTATLTEIEAAIDAHLTRLRTTMLQDAALATPAADWTSAAPHDRPSCPDCHTPLVARGKHSRRIQTHGGRDLVLDRTYGVCPTCGGGLFPPG